MAQGLAVEWIIRPAVFIFFFEAAADLDAIFGRDRYIAAVKKAVKIVRRSRPLFIECGPLSLNGLIWAASSAGKECSSVIARPSIGFCYKDPERALAKPGGYYGLLAVSGAFALEALGFVIQIE